MFCVTRAYNLTHLQQQPLSQGHLNGCIIHKLVRRSGAWFVEVGSSMFTRKKVGNTQQRALFSGARRTKLLG